MSYSQLVKHIHKPKAIALKPIQNKITNINSTIHQKKHSLLICLHGLLVSSFPKKVSKRDMLNLKMRSSLIRAIIHKLKSINHYLEEVSLRELGIVKKPLMLEALKKRKPLAYLTSKHKQLSKQDRVQLEATVLRLMQDIVRFDSKLIDTYQRELIKVQSSENLGIRDLEAILHRQSEYLDHLEAKVPPAEKVSLRIFSPKVMASLLPLIFALLHHLEREHERERKIFAKLKKGKTFRGSLERKIRHIVEEKQRILNLQQKRALAMEKFNAPKLREAFHQYIAAAHL